MMLPDEIKNKVQIINIENDFLKCSATPLLGGKIISVYNKWLQKEFLWKNEKLSLKQLEHSAYDSNFYGGIDELIPNDIPENIDGIIIHDHGELWTTPLEYEMKEESLILSGTLSLSELFYKKIIKLDDDSPTIKLSYTIKNISNDVRHFLWKLHAALKIQEDDKLITHAKEGKVVDTEYSRFANLDGFEWPMIEEDDASIIPPKNNTMDFFICMIRQLVKWNYYLRMNHLFFDTVMIKIFFLINGILLLMENSLITTLLF